MGKNTHIQWCDHTFNGWIGCTKVSPGCKFCYAEHETFVRRERAHGRELWGPAGTRHITTPDYWKQPLKWNNDAWMECTNCGERGQLMGMMTNHWDDLKGCYQSTLRTMRQRVFCMSLADALEDLPELILWRSNLVNLMEQTSNLDWLLLTKRIELAPDLLPYTWFNGLWPKNVWIGTSVENQAMADQRIPALLKCPAPVRFLSIEPMLEPVDIADFDAVEWVIVGGESGSKHRPFDWEWARQVRADCLAENIPFFMKQGGGYPDKQDRMEDFPENLRIREWPTP